MKPEPAEGSEGGRMVRSRACDGGECPGAYIVGQAPFQRQGGPLRCEPCFQMAAHALERMDALEPGEGRRKGELVEPIDWRLQFEVLIEEVEAYHSAHSKVMAHDPARCDGIGHGGNEWSCLRMTQALALCREVLAKHPLEPR